MAWRRAVMAMILALSGAALALGGCSKPAEKPPAKVFRPVAPPKRKPGLWEQRVSNGTFEQVSHICLDEASDARLSWWGSQATPDRCGTNPTTTRTNEGWRFSSVCDMGTGGTITTTGDATGDFNSRYKIVAESWTVGAAVQHMNGSHRMTINAVWQGPCPYGMKGGEMALPGGLKIDLLEGAGGR